MQILPSPDLSKAETLQDSPTQSLAGPEPGRQPPSLPAQTSPALPQPKHRKPCKRLTQAELKLISQLAADGLSQVAIAKRLDCDQSVVSRWLSDFTDTTDLAKSYLRGQALKMSQSIVDKGKPSDHVAALKGLSVLQEQQQAGLVVQVGAGAQVQINLGSSTFASPGSTVSEDLHRLTADVESDNSTLC